MKEINSDNDDDDNNYGDDPEIWFCILPSTEESIRELRWAGWSCTNTRHQRRYGCSILCSYSSFTNLTLSKSPVPGPRGLRRSSEATRLLRLWVRIPPGVWMSFCRECCVLSGRGLCDELITRPEESYRLWCVVMCELETSWMRRPWPTGGLLCQKQTNKQQIA